MIKAIIFDLYGVIGLNTWQDFKRAHFAERPQDWEQLRALGRRVDEGKASEEDLVDAVAHETGETTAIVRQQFEHTVVNAPLIHYIAKNLHGNYKLGVLSNASRDVIGGILAKSDSAMFDATISSYHVGYTKPDSRMFLLIAAQLGVEPSESLFIDDQSRHVAAAANLGFVTIQYKTTEQAIRAIEEAITT